MSVGRILTQGLGSFGGVSYLPTLGLGAFLEPEEIGPPSRGWSVKSESLTWTVPRIGTASVCEPWGKAFVMHDDC